MRSVCWTWPRSRSLRVAGAVVVVLGVTGCGAGVAGDSTQAAVAAPAAAAVHCPTSAKTPAMPLEPEPTQPVPAGFATAWVLRCTDQLRSVPGQGLWWLRVEERADTDAPALMAALRRPDGLVLPHMVCLDVAVLVPYFALVDASGTALRPRVPRDRCAQPQATTLAALRALPFHETGATRLHQEQSQESIDTGCGQPYGDAFLGDTLAHTRPAAARRMWRKTPDAVRICLWRPATSGLPQLESAGTVTGRTLAALLTRLDGLPAGTCTPRHQHFAVLEYVRHGWYDDPVDAELDGCGLVLRPDETLGHLDPATARLISTLAHR